jgi:hypothetical protein
MTLTRAEAAYYIYAFEVNDENKRYALELLENAKQEVVWLAHGDPMLPFGISIKRQKMEPWRYKTFLCEEKQKRNCPIVENAKEVESFASSESFETTSKPNL